MKKLRCLGITIPILFILFIYSCSSNDIDSSQETIGKKTTISGLSVVNLNDFQRSNTKSANNNIEYVLRFKDEATFKSVVDNLRSMSLEDQLDFYNQIEFSSASKQLYTADIILDKIFDIEDDALFLKEYESFKKENENFVYNTEDTYDMSPYLPFSDEDLVLVGDMKGRVIIGDSILSPKQQTPTYYNFINDADYTLANNNIYVSNQSMTPRALLEVPTSYSFNRFSPSVTMMIKSGKYQSTMTLGHSRTIERNILMVRFASQKKKKFWKRRHPTTYRGSIISSSIYGGNPFDVWCNKSEKEIVIPMPTIQSVPLGIKFTVRMFNFTSGCCSGVIGDQTFTTQAN